MFSFQGKSTGGQLAGILFTDIIFVAVVYGAYYFVTTQMGGLQSIEMPVMAVVLFVLSALTVPLFVATIATAIRFSHKDGESVVAPAAPVQAAASSVSASAVKPQTGAAAPIMQTPPVASPKPPVVSAPVTPPVSTPVQTSMPPMPKPSIPPVQTMPTPPVAPSTPSEAKAAPTNAPQARSMSEMLAELQKISAQQGELASKTAPAKAQAAAPVTPPPVPPVSKPQAPAPAMEAKPQPVAASAPVAKPASPAPQASVQAQAPVTPPKPAQEGLASAK